MKKKSVIITTAIILGIAGIGGTATYATTVNNHKEIVAEAKSDINADNKKLKELADTINNFELEGGYLSEDLTEDNLIKIEESLKQIKDTYTDYELEKDELNDEIKIVSDSKKEVDDQFKRIQSKFESQKLVNSLFSTKAIVSSIISDVAIADNVDFKTVENVSKSLGSVKEDNDWYLSLEGLVKQADGQLIQIDTAKKAIDALYKVDNVKEDVTMKQYDEAKDEVDFVKNESVQKKLEDKLELVLKQVKSNEEKARKEAEAQAQAEAEEESRLETEKLAQEAVTEKVAKTQTETQNSSSQSSNTEVSEGGSSTSTPNNSSGSKSSSSNSVSSGGSSSSSSGSSSSKTSNESASSQKPSNSTTDGGGTSTSKCTKTGEGDIKNHGGDGQSGKTYEAWTCDFGELSGVPWDEFSTSN
ncbi:hypothetical protein SAMN05421503_1408 [Terribacillus aidingensis]|uniref:N-terminal domain of peptidoglycan hydrolase CwlO-containing protein n=1 Tax=Terribacillus aidingensis TaxID=586416 RepID=A0A285NKA6_9BACI|nr:hypothetical protein [Terribacillus aidingensis]SNZ09899.1 hypothetical protein SAMN05421503_1408 [Terribacillus aidingensis]